MADRADRWEQPIEDQELGIPLGDQADEQPYLDPAKPVEDGIASSEVGNKADDDLFGDFTDTEDALAGRPVPVAMPGAEDSWFINKQCLVRKNSVPRLKLFVPTQAECPIPLEYLDVMRTTTTSLDRQEETRVEDFWIGDDTEKDRELSWWTGETLFEFRCPVPPPGKVYCQGELLTQEEALEPPTYDLSAGGDFLNHRGSEKSRDSMLYQKNAISRGKKEDCQSRTKLRKQTSIA